MDGEMQILSSHNCRDAVVADLPPSQRQFIGPKHAALERASSTAHPTVKVLGVGLLNQVCFVIRLSRA
jgi:hypothetical protein